MKSFFSGMRKCKCHINIKTEGLEEIKRSSEVQIRSNRNNFCHHHEFSPYYEVLHIMKFYNSIRGSQNDVIGTGKYEQALSMLLQVIFLRLFEADHLKLNHYHSSVLLNLQVVPLLAFSPYFFSR